MKKKTIILLLLCFSCFLIGWRLHITQTLVLNINHFTLNAELDLVKRTNGNCSDRICSEYLTKPDYPHFNYCMKKTWGMKRHAEPGKSVCRFMNGVGRYPVALASYPGSGNTWVRGLIQAATGLCTGGVYCDTTLRANGFPGEEIRSGVVLAVKTHQTDPRWTGVQYDNDLPLSYYKRVEDIPIFSGAILLVRNPFDAMVSEYNRQLNVDSPDNHILQSGPEAFGKPN